MNALVGEEEDFIIEFIRNGQPVEFSKEFYGWNTGFSRNVEADSCSFVLYFL